MKMKEILKKLLRCIMDIGIIITITMCLFIFIEGVFSIRWVNTIPRYEAEERVHTEYDAQLGWINEPNLFVKDMYGEGKNLTTNNQRFRNKRDFPKSVPAGKMRVVCSGDSFTLGCGVDDDDAWCSVLSGLDDKFEAVNMGQGGYSVGQAYLWYLRQGKQIEHDFHLFTFIYSDFKRMQKNKFLIYDKPLLNLKEGRITVSNYPLPKRTYLLSGLFDYVDRLNELRVVKVLREWSKRKYNFEGPELLTLKDVKDISGKIFDELNAINEEKGSRFILVFLPRRIDYQSREADGSRRFVAKAAEEKGIVFVDLIKELKKLSHEKISGMFLNDGHYSKQGHEWVAEVLHKQMLSLL